MAKGKYRDGRRNNRPPPKNQFKPGQSGNNKGRPTKPRISAKQMVGRLLSEKHPIVVRGRQKMVPLVEMILMKIFDLALKGNPRAIMWAMELIEQAEIIETERIRQPPNITDFKKKLENMTLEELDAEYRQLVEEDSDFGRKR
jgi:hypothetical protein